MNIKQSIITTKKVFCSQALIGDSVPEWLVSGTKTVRIGWPGFKSGYAVLSLPLAPVYTVGCFAVIYPELLDRCKTTYPLMSFHLTVRIPSDLRGIWILFFFKYFNFIWSCLPGKGYINRRWTNSDVHWHTPAKPKLFGKLHESCCCCRLTFCVHINQALQKPKSLLKKWTT